MQLKIHVIDRNRSYSFIICRNAIGLAKNVCSKVGNAKQLLGNLALGITGNFGAVFVLFCRIIVVCIADIAQDGSFPEKQNNYIDKTKKEHSCLVKDLTHEGICQKKSVLATVVNV